MTSFWLFSGFYTYELVGLFFAILINLWIRFFIYKKNKKIYLNIIVDLLLYILLDALLATSIRHICWCGDIGFHSNLLDTIFAQPYWYFIFTEILIFLSIALRRIFLFKENSWFKFIFLERVILLIGYLVFSSVNNFI